MVVAKKAVAKKVAPAKKVPAKVTPATVASKAVTSKAVVKAHTLPTAEEVVAAFSKALGLLSLYDGPAAVGVDKIVPTKKAAAAKVAPAEVEEEEEEEADEDEAQEDRRIELEAMGIRALRTLAKQFFDDADVKDADKETLVENILSADEEAEEEEEEADEEEEEEEEEEAEEEEEEAEGFDPDELAEMGLVALKKLAVENGYAKADLEGYKKDDIIALLIPEEEEEEEEAEEESEEEEEEEELTEEELQAMSPVELKKLCAAYEIEVPRGTKKDGMITLLMEAAEEE